MPKVRTSFWEEKFRQNIERDYRKIIALRELGWNTLVVWECETKTLPILTRRLVDFLSSPTDS